jgi:hypothetical protein
MSKSTYSIAEITQKYIKKARDADYARAEKKKDILQVVAHKTKRGDPAERAELRGYSKGKLAATQADTTKRSKKLLSINKRRRKERREDNE